MDYSQIRGRWTVRSDWQGSPEEKEDALVQMNKRFRWARHSIYILQRMALRIQHWYFFKSAKAMHQRRAAHRKALAENESQLMSL